MNLIIDFGNTRVKAALFTDRLVELKIYKDGKELLADQLFIARARHAIVASVVTHHTEVVEELSKKMRVMLFSADTPLPVKNGYRSVQTLGSDRLAASIGALSAYPNRNVLVIDAGTCIKYNFMNAANVYEGGGISPGLQMRLKALHHYTGRLPLVEFDPDFNELTGQTTNASILSGVLNGAIFEIDGTIEAYRRKYADLTILITGGDAPFLAERLKNPIFAQPNLVLTGLNTILKHCCESNPK